MLSTFALMLLQVAPAPPPGLQFGFYRMAAFQQRAKELRCNRGALDAEFEMLRKRLAERYGKQAFKLPKIPNSGPGDCGSAESVYRVNLADFRKEVEAVLSSPAPPPSN
jgi:hypothetical protein